MIYNYPVLSITLGAIAAYVIATRIGALFVRAGFPVPSAERRIGAVDGLRGYLALSVLVHHFIFWIQVTRLGGEWTVLSVPVFSNLGGGAVALFFMATGLVFYPRVLAGFRATLWTATFTTRVFRIMPLVILSVAVITLIIAMRAGSYKVDERLFRVLLHWISCIDEPDILGYTNSIRLNAGVLWSLKYEWVFYIAILPACAFGMDLIRGRLPSWSVPAALLLGGLTLRLFHPPTGMTAFLPLFAAGMLAFEIQRSSSIREILRSRWTALPAALSLAIALASAPTPFGLVQLPLYAFFFASVACGNDIFGILRSNGALLLGECSYGIYISHGIILNLLFVDGAPLVNRFTTDHLPIFLPMAAIAAVCVSPFIFIYIERPAIRLGSALARRLRVRRTDRGAEAVPQISTSNGAKVAA